jgi:hypothetical protein
MFHQILLGDHIREDEKGGACSMHEKDEKLIQSSGQKSGRDVTNWKTWM